MKDFPRYFFLSPIGPVITYKWLTNPQALLSKFERWFNNRYGRAFMNGNKF